MSKESKPKRTRSTKKSRTSELEAKIVELEARLANLSSQVQPGAARAAGRKEAPKPQARAEAEPTPEPLPGEVSPAYATISSSGYTGNRYYATRPRLSYHPPSKQFRGTVSSTTTAPPPPPPAHEPRLEPRVSQTRSKLRAGMEAPEKKSLWRSKGAEYENYGSMEEKKTSPPPQPKSEPKRAPRPKPKPAPQAEVIQSEMPEAVGEVSPAYATISSSGYTGNRYYATRPRLSYHPPSKQFRGDAASTTAPPPAPEPPKPKSKRGTLPAGFKH